MRDKGRNIPAPDSSDILQLCAENNLQVCYPTTPAQYFHLAATTGPTGNGATVDRDDAEESPSLARGIVDSGGANDRWLPARD